MQDNQKTASTTTAMSIIGGLFFIFGFVTWLNGPLISFVKLAFSVDDFSAFLVPSVFYISYFFLSLPAAFLLKQIGMKRGMALGLIIMAIGAFVFGQATNLRIFSAALAGLFTLGAGLSILQTASNPYISILGPIDSAASRIAFMGICNKIAGILAPIVVGQMILNGVGDVEAAVKAAATPEARAAILDAFAHKVYLPYLAMAILMAGLAFFVLKSPLPDIRDETNNPEAGGDHKSLGAFIPQMAMGFLAIFFYVGVEVLAGDAIGTYGRSFGLPLDQTKFFTSFTLGAMLIGYVVGLLTIPRFISQSRYLTLSALLGIVLAIGAASTKGYISVGFVATLGFANAMMWPAIFPLGIKGLGRWTEIGSAMMIMGIVGGAALPQSFAYFKNQYDFQLVFSALEILAYLYILFFAMNSDRKAAA